ncbi:TadE family protein [Ramlibacter sp. AN1015]|uniref:TadE family protein n=1 Tax=Ramlibacter sp. AN1015 TaxID=3133428 RepID=UPI0030BF8671
MNRTNQRGATAIEFAMVMILFLTFLLGIVDFSRMLFMWGAANEATRAGARFAVVCHDNTSAHSDAVRSRMRGVLPHIADISIVWDPPACTPETCQGVTVGIENLNFQWITPMVGTLVRPTFAMPRFQTYLPREVMRQDDHSDSILCNSTS